jgi:glycosyltransferase involved in cell wall biosynthesis
LIGAKELVMSAPRGGAPLVSILIPAYNVEPFLANCIESALAQTYPATEIVVVDDGSTDGTLAIARRYESGKVKVISQPNGGQPAAYNTAAAVAQGAYFQYLDADDLLHPEKIGKQMARLAGASPTTVATGAWTRFVDDVNSAQFIVQPVWADLDPVTWLSVSWTGGGMMHVASWLVPREVAEAAGPWVVGTRWATNVDGDFFTRAVLASDGCVFVADARAYYRSVPNSHSARRDRRSLAASLGVLLSMGDALLAVEDSERTRLAFAVILQQFVYDIYPAAPDLVASGEGHIKRLGGARLRFSAGRSTTVLARLIGWKYAKRFRQMVQIPGRGRR